MNTILYYGLGTVFVLLFVGTIVGYLCALLFKQKLESEEAK